MDQAELINHNIQEARDAELTAIREEITQHPSLQELWLVDRQLTPADLRSLELQQIGSLQGLMLGENPLQDEGALCTASLLCTLNLFVLELDFCGIGDLGSVALAHALVNHRHLSKLSLRYNQIGSAGGKALGSALSCNSSLSQLDIEYNNLDDAAMQSIFTGLQKNDTLVHLNLSGNAELGTEGARLLGRLLKTNNSLASLRLSKIRDIAQDCVAQKLARSLACHHSLQELYLCGVMLTDAGGRPLVDALRTNTSLVTLELFDNQLGYRTAAALARSLCVNTTLRRVSLSQNRIDSQGAEALLSAFGDNSSIVTISLSVNTDVSPTFCVQLQQHCLRNKANCSVISPCLLERLLDSCF